MEDAFWIGIMIFALTLTFFMIKFFVEGQNFGLERYEKFCTENNGTLRNNACWVKIDNSTIERRYLTEENGSIYFVK